MKFIEGKRKKLVAGIILLLLVCAGVWLLAGGSGYMSADVTSSNGSRYAVELPSSMKPANINDNASLQYEDEARGLYVVVIDESKAKIISFGLDYDLDTYMKIASRTLDSAGLYVNKPVTVNGFKALQTEIKGKSKGKEVIYKLTCLESPKFFYQVLLRSEASGYESNSSDMDKITNSFREVDAGFVNDTTVVKK